MANVEVYDPSRDEWEDGIPMTSGRSGLASAVIYQPSCVQSFMDCYPCPSKSEYDDNHKRRFNEHEKPPGGCHGASTSFDFNCGGRNRSCGNSEELEAQEQKNEEEPEEKFKPNDNLVRLDSNNLLVAVDSRREEELTDIHSTLERMIDECPIVRFKNRLGRYIWVSIRDHITWTRNSRISDSNPSNIRRCCIISKFKSKGKNRYSKCQ